jgi:glycogen debranching enzyme
LLPNVWRAVEWIDKYADVDGDGFYEYVASNSHTGIRNQVWKDSGDSIQFPDGTLAETPIAAVEVQGYVYAAKKGLADVLRSRGMPDEAQKLESEAEALKKHFNEVFWLQEEGFYTQGLDRDKRKVAAITTNPGHALWCGIADEDKAAATARRLMDGDMLSGWGLRTLSEGYPSYNPMSYHNGSIWPHDNSIVVAGLRRYGCDQEAQQVITQIYEASRFFRYSRLPELYCGFKRDTTYQSGPAEYPVSCSPQAWAAGASILFAQAMLGLEADAHQERLRIRPSLPDWLNTMRVSNLRIGNKRVELIVEKRDGRHDVAITGGDTGVSLEIS